jgi:hypothetical protein
MYRVVAHRSFGRKARGHQAWALRLLAESASHREPPAIAPAEAHYREAIALADELGMRPLQAHCYRGLGILYSRVERLEEARGAVYGSSHVPHHGDVPMATAGRGDAGADRGEVAAAGVRSPYVWNRWDSP